MDVPDSTEVFGFFGFSLDSRRRLLFGPDGRSVPLTGRAFDTLLYLVEHPNQLIEKNTLMKVIWPHSVVEENNLNQNISILRRALGETPGEHRFVVTVPGRGFLFVPQVTRGLTVRGSTGSTIVQSGGDPGGRMKRLVTPQLKRVSRPSIAVLPFSSDPEQEYFSDGLSEALINQLAHVNGLRVAARTSCFAFKGKNEDLRVIGEKLSVDRVLEGSVRKAGQRLRVTAQLIDCADGYHLWCETFDRELKDVFAIQDDIARSVAGALGVVLGVAETAAPGGTRDLEAYDLYLRARSLALTYGPQPLRRAAELCREALARDPQFALAWALLAGAIYVNTVVWPEATSQLRKPWDQAVERAVAIAPDLWESQLALGRLETYRRHWVAAEDALNRAVQRTPQSTVESGVSLGNLLCSLGRVEEAIVRLRAACAADPLAFPASATLQIPLTVAGRDEEAEKEYRRSRDLVGDRTAIEHMALIRAWVRGDALGSIRANLRQFIGHSSVPMPVQSELLDLLDQPAAARARLRQAFGNPAYQDATRQFTIALWAAQFDDVDLALAAARRAYVELHSWTLFLLWLPVCRTMRRDVRFKQLLRDLGIVDYWRQTGHWGEFARPVGDDDFEIIR